MEAIATQSLDQALSVWNPYCLDLLDFSINWPSVDLIAEVLDGVLRAESPCDCPLADHTLYAIRDVERKIAR